MATGLIILTGGKSSRMGTNKALLPVNGKTNIEQVIDTLAPQFPNLILVTNNPETYHWLNVSMTSDVYVGKGPLAGIHAGLKTTLCEQNLVVACDMPFVSSALGVFLAANSEGYDAVVPCWGGQIHPLFAIYRKSCLAIIENCLQKDQLRMLHLLNQLNVRYLGEKELSAIISSDEPFTNMNSPEEYQEVLNRSNQARSKNEK